MSGYVKYDKSILPPNLKIITDVNKILGIQAQEQLNFIILTDSVDLDKESIKNNQKKLYFIVDQSATLSNECYSLIRDLKRAEFNLTLKAVTDIGQIETIKSEFQTKIHETKSSAETDSKEHEKLRSFFDGILKEAFESKASDIHIEKRKESAVIKMRKNGELTVTHSNQPVKMIEELCRIIHDVFAEREGKEVTYLPHEYQQAAINRVIKDEDVKLRFQSLPTYPEGFDVVMRLLPLGKDDEVIIPLTKLGFEASQEKQIKDIISKPVGALIIAGTTGSGKSTTLKNLLMSVNLAREYRCKIYTIEDPPEYKIPFVSQIPVTRRKDTANPFEAPLMATMRGDPDLLMIGEIRDRLTGDGLKKATQSGHQVMTTVHAPSGLGIVERLSDFNISPNIMSSPDFITGLLYQKLLPVLCQECAKSFDELVESAGSGEDIIELKKRLDDVFGDVQNPERLNIKVRNNEGCKHCNDTGITGRTICAEIISPDFDMLNFFRNQDMAGALKYWLDTSDDNILSTNMKGKSAQEHAILKMSKGLISPLDLETAFGPVNHTKLKRLQLAEQKHNNLSMQNFLENFGITSDMQNKVKNDKNKSLNKVSDKDQESDNGVDITSNMKFENWDQD